MVLRQPCGTQMLHAVPVNCREGYNSVSLQGTQHGYFDSAYVRNLLDQIQIEHAGSISFGYKHTQRFSTL